MSESLKQIEDYRRQVLADLLAQCTLEQIDLFNRMYGSIEDIRDDQIDWAIQQCERTIKENKERG